MCVKSLFAASESGRVYSIEFSRRMEIAALMKRNRATVRDIDRRNLKEHIERKTL